jgi:outer membrane biogenesis lipoprotein LolB
MDDVIRPFLQLSSLWLLTICIWNIYGCLFYLDVFIFASTCGIDMELSCRESRDTSPAQAHQDNVQSMIQYASLGRCPHVQIEARQSKSVQISG